MSQARVDEKQHRLSFAKPTQGSPSSVSRRSNEVGGGDMSDVRAGSLSSTSQRCSLRGGSCWAVFGVVFDPLFLCPTYPSSGLFSSTAGTSRLPRRGLRSRGTPYVFVDIRPNLSFSPPPPPARSISDFRRHGSCCEWWSRLSRPFRVPSESGAPSGNHTYLPSFRCRVLDRGPVRHPKVRREGRRPLVVTRLFPAVLGFSHTPPDRCASLFL